MNLSKMNIETNFRVTCGGTDEQIDLLKGGTYTIDPNMYRCLFMELPSGNLSGKAGDAGLSWAVNAGGTDYVVGDVITVTQAGGTGQEFFVSTVSGGAVTGLVLKSAGTGYTAATGLPTTTTSVAGAGLTVDANVVAALPTGLQFEAFDTTGASFAESAATGFDWYEDETSYIVAVAMKVELTGLSASKWINAITLRYVGNALGVSSEFDFFDTTAPASCVFAITDGAATPKNGIKVDHTADSGKATLYCNFFVKVAK